MSELSRVDGMFELPITIKYKSENGWPEPYSLECTLKTHGSEYLLTWKEDEGFDYPDKPKTKTHRKILTSEMVEPMLARLSKGSYPLACKVNDYTDGASYTLSIQGISSVEVQFSWCSCDLVGFTKLNTCIKWLENQCDRSEDERN